MPTIVQPFSLSSRSSFSRSKSLRWQEKRNFKLFQSGVCLFRASLARPPEEKGKKGETKTARIATRLPTPSPLWSSFFFFFFFLSGRLFFCSGRKRRCSRAGKQKMGEGGFRLGDNTPLPLFFQSSNSRCGHFFIQHRELRKSLKRQRKVTPHILFYLEQLQRRLLTTSPE